MSDPGLDIQAHEPPAGRGSQSFPSTIMVLTVANEYEVLNGVKAVVSMLGLLAHLLYKTVRKVLL
jgi:hypothetical protein